MEVEVYSSRQAEGLCVDALRRALAELATAQRMGERAGFGSVWMLMLQQGVADIEQALREADQ